MQTAKAFLACVILLLAGGISWAMADGGHGWHGGGHGGHDGHYGHGHVGVVIGVPGPWYPYGGYYYPYYPYAYPYYYPSAVAVPAPTTYIQQQAAPAPESGDSAWYYCASSKSYYPYVTQCASGWIHVSPTPPDH
jgi:hypothetical protein